MSLRVLCASISRAAVDGLANSMIGARVVRRVAHRAA